MNEKRPEQFPWNDLSEVPDSCLFNMDEVGKNGDHGRAKKLASRVLETKNWMRVLDKMKTPEPNTVKRMFEVRLGDKNDGLQHRTLSITTCANGLFSSKIDGKFTEGACAPMLIHASTSSSKKLKQGELPKVTPKMTAGIYDTKTGESRHGIKVSTQPPIAVLCPVQVQHLAY